MQQKMSLTHCSRKTIYLTLGDQFMSASIPKTAKVMCDLCYDDFDKKTTDQITTCTHHICLSCLTKPVQLTCCKVRGCCATIKIVAPGSTTDKAITSVGSEILRNQKGRVTYVNTLLVHQKAMPFKSLGPMDSVELDKLFELDQLIDLRDALNSSIGFDLGDSVMSLSNILALLQKNFPETEVNTFIQALESIEPEGTDYEKIIKILTNALRKGNKKQQTVSSPVQAPSPSAPSIAASSAQPASRPKLEEESLTQTQSILSESELKLRFEQLRPAHWSRLDNSFSDEQLTSLFTNLSIYVDASERKFSYAIIFMMKYKKSQNINFFLDALKRTNIDPSVYESVLSFFKEALPDGIQEKKIDLIPVTPSSALVVLENPVDYSQVSLSKLKEIPYSTIDSYITPKILEKLKILIINEKLKYINAQNVPQSTILKILQINNLQKLIGFWIESDSEAKSSEFIYFIDELKRFKDVIPDRVREDFKTKLLELLDSEFKTATSSSAPSAAASSSAVCTPPPSERPELEEEHAVAASSTPSSAITTPAPEAKEKRKLDNIELDRLEFSDFTPIDALFSAEEIQILINSEHLEQFTQYSFFATSKMDKFSDFISLLSSNPFNPTSKDLELALLSLGKEPEQLESVFEFINGEITSLKSSRVDDPNFFEPEMMRIKIADLNIVALPRLDPYFRSPATLISVIKKTLISSKPSLRVKDINSLEGINSFTVAVEILKYLIEDLRVEQILPMINTTSKPELRHHVLVGFKSILKKHLQNKLNAESHSVAASSTQAAVSPELNEVAIASSTLPPLTTTVSEERAEAASSTPSSVAPVQTPPKAHKTQLSFITLKNLVFCDFTSLDHYFTIDEIKKMIVSPSLKEHIKGYIAQPQEITTFSELVFQIALNSSMEATEDLELAIIELGKKTPEHNRIIRGISTRINRYQQLYSIPISQLIESEMEQIKLGELKDSSFYKLDRTFKDVEVQTLFTLLPLDETARSAIKTERFRNFSELVSLLTKHAPHLTINDLKDGIVSSVHQALHREIFTGLQLIFEKHLQDKRNAESNLIEASSTQPAVSPELNDQPIASGTLPPLTTTISEDRAEAASSTPSSIATVQTPKVKRKRSLPQIDLKCLEFCNFTQIDPFFTPKEVQDLIKGKHLYKFTRNYLYRTYEITKFSDLMSLLTSNSPHPTSENLENAILELQKDTDEQNSIFSPIVQQIRYLLNLVVDSKGFFSSEMRHLRVAELKKIDFTKFDTYFDRAYAFQTTAVSILSENLPVYLSEDEAILHQENMRRLYQVKTFSEVINTLSQIISDLKVEKIIQIATCSSDSGDRDHVLTGLMLILKEHLKEKQDAENSLIDASSTQPASRPELNDQPIASRALPPLTMPFPEERARAASSTSSSAPITLTPEVQDEKSLGRIELGRLEFCDLTPMDPFFSAKEIEKLINSDHLKEFTQKFTHQMSEVTKFSILVYFLAYYCPKSSSKDLEKALRKLQKHTTIQNSIFSFLNKQITYLQVLDVNASEFFSSEMRRIKVSELKNVNFSKFELLVGGKPEHHLEFAKIIYKGSKPFGTEMDLLKPNDIKSFSQMINKLSSLIQGLEIDIIITKLYELCSPINKDAILIGFNLILQQYLDSKKAAEGRVRASPKPQAPQQPRYEWL